MIVDVHLHTVLQRQTPEGLVRRLDFALPSQSTVGYLLNQLAIDFPLESLLLVVNGRLVEEDHVLQEGDKVNLMPAISGGVAGHGNGDHQARARAWAITLILAGKNNSFLGCYFARLRQR